ncbi:MAG: CdaR family transcriptional regulator [Thermovirgaceae bacterium]
MLERFAQKICEATHKIIGYDVLITNEAGIVIGTNDQSRMGTLHAPSLDCMSRRREVFTDEKTASLFPDVRPGVTLPISLSGKVIGSIAIAGNHKEVAPFGQLVEKHAEIFLREQIITESSLARERALEDLVLEIASFDPDQQDISLLVARGRELGFDLECPRIGIALDIFREIPGSGEQALHEYFPYSPLRIETLAVIRSVFTDRQDLCAESGDGRFTILKKVTFKGLDDENTLQGELEDTYQLLRRKLTELGGTVSMGSGSLSRKAETLHLSYCEAWNALMIGKKQMKLPGLFKISDFRLEELLLSVNIRRCKSFTSREIGNLKSLPDWEAIRDTINAWKDNPCRPGIVADGLNIHRNTLRYRIEKIRNITGRDLKNFRDAFSLYLAVSLEDLLELDRCR